MADNALFIAAIALIQELHGPDWMAPIMKWSFALAYVVLAAFVGAFADSFPKGRVMFATNALKVAGCLLMFAYASLGIAPEYQTYFVVAAYAVVGVGAAAYSPAKYGILVEIAHDEKLVKANGLMEASTIAAILLGSVAGGILADWNLIAALAVCALTYAVAVTANLFIPKLHAVTATA